MKNPTLVPVDKTNYQIAIQIQSKVFPEKSGANDILSSTTKQSDMYDFLQYFLMKVDDKFVGLCGLYSYKAYPTEPFFAWLGVLEEHRNHGYGSFAIKQMTEYAKERGFSNVRLYTDDGLCRDACRLYDKFFDIKETYWPEDGQYFRVGKTIVYSKNLNGKKVKKWGNKSLFLAEHESNNNDSHAENN